MAERPIKSVQRVFEILELFDQERCPIAAKDVSKRLNYPLMSTHELLKSMHKLGYADFDPDARTYMPSIAVPTIVEWVRGHFSVPHKILDFMSALSDETRETINLSRRTGLKVRISYGIESKHAFGVIVRMGTMMPLTGSLTGLVALASLDDEKCEDMLRRIDAADETQMALLQLDRLGEVKDALEETGMVTQCDVMINGIGAICFPVLLETTSETAVVGVVGPSDRIQANETQHRETVAKLVRKHKIKTLFPVTGTIPSSKAASR